MSSDDIIQLGSSDEEEMENGRQQQTISVSVSKERPLDLQKILGITKKIPPVAGGLQFPDFSIPGVSQQNEQQNKKPVHIPIVNQREQHAFLHRNNGLKRGAQQSIANIHEKFSKDEESKRRRIEQIIAYCSTNATEDKNNKFSGGPSTSKNSQSSNKKNNNLSHNDLTKYRKFCDTYLVSSEKRGTGFNVTEEDFLGQFECTYQNCGKRLKDNISLIWHVWAHVVQQKPTESEEITNLQIREDENREQIDDEDEEMTDVGRLLTCPECLLTQPNPYRIQLHYRRVHKRDGMLTSDSLFNCNICETVIAKKDIAAHIQAHRIGNQNQKEKKAMLIEMPYSCRFNTKKCQFRTSTRAALIEHFCSVHRGTFVLLCPFCLYTFSIPPAERKRNKVQMKDFMRHIQNHDIEKTLFCGRCVVRFAKSSSQLYRTHLNLQHNNSWQDERKMNWPIATRSLADIKKSKSIAIEHEILSRQCLECKMVMKASRHEHHSLNTLICPNAKCQYSTNCKRAFANHQLLGPCNPANAIRWPFGRPKSSAASSNSSSFESKPTLCCSGCQFATKNVQKIVHHLLEQKCPNGRIRVEHFPSAEEFAEARIFGLDGMDYRIGSINNVEKKNGKKLESPEQLQRTWLAEFLPPTRIQEIAQNQKALIYFKEEKEEKVVKEKKNQQQPQQCSSTKKMKIQEQMKELGTVQALRLALTSDLPNLNETMDLFAQTSADIKKKKRVL